MQTGPDRAEATPGAGDASDPDRELVEFYAPRLQFLWEQYMRFVQLTLIMSGATIGILLNVTLISQNARSLSRRDLVFWAICFAGVAGLCSLFWRMTAQVLMERQLYAQPEKAKRFFEITGTEKPLALKINLKWLHWFNEGFKYASAPLLLASWTICIWFVLVNLNR